MPARRSISASRRPTSIPPPSGSSSGTRRAFPTPRGWWASSSTMSRSAFRSGALGASLLSVTALNSGDIAVRTVNQPLGTGEQYNVTDLAIGVGYGLQITDRVAARRPAQFHPGDHLAQLGQHRHAEHRHALPPVGERPAPRSEHLELRHLRAFHRARSAASPTTTIRRATATTARCRASVRPGATRCRWCSASASRSRGRSVARRG